MGSVYLSLRLSFWYGMEGACGKLAELAFAEVKSWSIISFRWESLSSNLGDLGDLGSSTIILVRCESGWSLISLLFFDKILALLWIITGYFWENLVRVGASGLINTFLLSMNLSLSPTSSLSFTITVFLL